MFNKASTLRSIGASPTWLSCVDLLFWQLIKAHWHLPLNSIIQVNKGRISHLESGVRPSITQCPTNEMLRWIVSWFIRKCNSGSQGRQWIKERQALTSYFIVSEEWQDNLIITAVIHKSRCCSKRCKYFLIESPWQPDKVVVFLYPFYRRIRGDLGQASWCVLAYTARENVRAESPDLWPYSDTMDYLRIRTRVSFEKGIK